MKKVKSKNNLSKNQILRNIRHAVKEVNLIKATKMKGISAKDLLNEL